ncbi:pilus assembly protein TadG-related protein [Pseudooceanicola sp. C21-150M6]|uniref:TadE/TadG family type IV pilus assembly protein n=1 Tax=Pseudooceanicola sp. C21-150M6 TaxID=3434355 RepID=UPI003D7FA238
MLRRFLRGYARNEDGAVFLTLVIFLMLTMMLVVGISVDLMRTEMQRTRLQQTIDASVLAAAHRDNSLDPVSVVLDYFNKAELASYVTADDVETEGVAGSRYVQVNLTADIQTPFLNMMGRNSLTIPARGRAEEQIGNAEISLVLDISGSMNQNSRMTRLHTAAGDFLDTVLKPESEDKISVSVVPYTADVNAGKEIFSRMNVRQLHNYSYCVQFLPTDFDNTEIDPDKAYIQGQYFSWASSNFTQISCPTQSYETITAFSQNKDALKSQINSMTGREQTSIHLGMKWGIGLLDPAFQPVIADMVDDGLIDDAFDGRPVDYSENVLKTVVLMTDGVNTTSRRIMPFAYDTPAMRYHWSRHTIDSFEDDVDNSLESDIFEIAYDNTSGNAALASLCTKAKEAGIVIWTIGFEIDNSAATHMENCASSASHFYRVEGLEIAEAFGSIARQLKQLRLTY